MSAAYASTVDHHASGKPAVWVSRTEPGASRLAERLASLGYGVVKAPVLQIEPTRCPPPSGTFDFALFVSEHAVVHGLGSGWRPPANTVVAAIGRAGERALRQFGVEPGLTGLADATAVTTAWTSPPPCSLIVKGEDGRDVVQEWLRLAGSAVSEWNVYQRMPARLSIHGRRIDVIVAASGEGVKRIAEVWLGGQPMRGGSPTDRVPWSATCPAGVTMFVPSERVRALAKDAGFTDLCVTLGASDDAVIAGLERRAPASHGGRMRLSATS